MIGPKILGDVQRQCVNAVELGHPALQGQAQLRAVLAVRKGYPRQWRGRKEAKVPKE